MKKVILLAVLICLAIGSYGQTSKQFENMGLVQEKRKNYAGAILDFTKAIKINPRNIYLYGYRGLDKEKLQDYRGALADYNKMIGLDPKWDIAYSFRAGAKLALGDDLNGAMSDYKMAIELKPNSYNYYSEGLAFADYLFLYDLAVKDFNIAIEMNPKNADAFRDRGRIKCDIKNSLNYDFAGGMEDLNKAIELDPNNAGSFYIRGSVKHRMGDKEGACLDWSKAGELGEAEAYDMIKEYCN